MGKTKTKTQPSVLPLLTVREAREVYHCSRSTVYRWIDRGRLQKVGNVPGHDDYQEQSVLLLQVVDDELTEKLEDWTRKKSKRGKKPEFLSEKLELRSISDLAAAVREAAAPKAPEPEEAPISSEMAALLGATQRREPSTRGAARRDREAAARERERRRSGRLSARCGRS